MKYFELLHQESISYPAFLEFWIKPFAMCSIPGKSKELVHLEDIHIGLFISRKLTNNT